MGERTLRRLLIIGASATVRFGNAQGLDHTAVACAHAEP